MKHCSTSRSSRQRTSDAAGSTEAQFASATTETEDLLRTRQWCNQHPIAVSRFVRCVLPPDTQSSHPRNPGGGGRSIKSDATKKADKARLAALMAARKEVECAGGSWDPVCGCAVTVGSTSKESAQPDEDEVECLGQSTRAEAEAARHEAGVQEAVDLASED